MGEILLGAGLSVLGGFLLAFWQSKRTEMLTLRLRRLERQERALLRLTKAVSRITFDLRDSSSFDPTSDEQSRRDYLRGWRAATDAVVDLLGDWHGKIGYAVYDQKVVDCFDPLAYSLFEVGSTVEAAEQRPDVETISSLQVAGSYLIDWLNDIEDRSQYLLGHPGTRIRKRSLVQRLKKRLRRVTSRRSVKARRRVS